MGKLLEQIADAADEAARSMSDGYYSEADDAAANGLRYFAQALRARAALATPEEEKK